MDVVGREVFTVDHIVLQEMADQGGDVVTEMEGTTNIIDEHLDNVSPSSSISYAHGSFV